MSYRELTAPDLVKQWKKLVNDNISIGRDSHLIKQFLQGVSPAQILLGMYQYQGNRTISIPQFLKQSNEWLELDEEEVDIDLAICVTNHVPQEYYDYHDYKEEENARSYQISREAKTKLKEWAGLIIQ